MEGDTYYNWRGYKFVVYGSRRIYWYPLNAVVEPDLWGQPLPAPIMQALNIWAKQDCQMDPIEFLDKTLGDVAI